MQSNVSLAPYTYSKIGGQAEFLTIANSQDELIAAVQSALAKNMPYRVLGGGSNILISDNGLPGLTVINRSSLIKLHHPQSNYVTADSGVVVNNLVNTVTREGLGGLEEFLGIPGTVGGAVYNNSHYLQKLIGEYITQVKIIDDTGTVRLLSQAECHFDYDLSIFHSKPYVVLSAEFKLHPTNPQTAGQKALAALKRRRDTQPLEFPSSGCVFKNPNLKEGRQSAGFLIDQSGCKGLKVGGAQVSPKHASFIINTGSATAADYYQLAEQVRSRVFDRFGIKLDYEIIKLGDFKEVPLAA